MADFIRSLAKMIYGIGGLVVFYLAFVFVIDFFSVFWLVVSIVIFPLLFYLVPVISIFMEGDWTMFFISYGGSVFCLLLIFIAAVIDGDHLYS